MLSETDLQNLYLWIDQIPSISRPKKNITRDFSDGVIVAEILQNFIPKLVDMHNYPACSSQKLYNWNTLNYRVFKKIGYTPNRDLIDGVVNCRPGVVEVLLSELRQKLENYMSKQQQHQHQTSNTPSPSKPQYYNNTSPQHQQYQQSNRHYKHTQEHHGGHGQAFGKQQFELMQKQGGDQRFLRNDDDGGEEEDKDLMIQELKETIGMLQVKVGKLEQLLTLKDGRIEDMVLILKRNNIK